MFNYIKGIHATVNSTIKDLKESGWKEIDTPVIGSVIIWKPGEDTNNHFHIGFYIGDNLAVSNDSFKKHPVKADWKFGGKREIDTILWNPEINKEE